MRVLNEFEKDRAFTEDMHKDLKHCADLSTELDAKMNALKMDLIE